MYSVSEYFLESIRHSHHSVTKATITNILGEQVDVEVLSGDVTEDKSALIRRRANLTLSGVDPDFILPTTDNFNESPLWPIGTEFAIQSGILYDDGTEELVPLGKYRIAKPTISHTNADVTITIEGYDYSRTMSRNRFTDQYWIGAGTDFAVAIKSIVMDRLPFLDETVDFNFMITDGSDGGSVYTTPWMVFIAQDDPWEKVTEMANSIGAEIFFNGSGQCVLRPELDPLFTPSQFDYTEGENATFDTIDRAFDDEQAYNGVIVISQTAENDEVVYRGEAWDTNPNSPTYYDPDKPEESSYGAVPYFMVSDYITSNAQARAAAKVQLNKVIGIVEQVNFTAICNPAHEAGDVIAIKDSITGVEANYLLESYQLGLGASNSMSGTTRKRRIP